jgi:hypothetical protein
MKVGKHKSSAVLKRLVFVVALSCVLGCGGQDDVATTWSAEAKSPDGRWLATARSQQWGGPGTAYDATTVSLKKLHSSDPPKQVLLFSHQFGTMNLDMKWLTATHLDVTYGPSARAGDHVNLDSKIARFDGIEISVQNLTDEQVKTLQ